MRRRRLPIISDQELCLGLVIVATPGRMGDAIAQLEATGKVEELGQPKQHRLPACTTVNAGDDEQLLLEIEGLPAVLKAEIVYAELLPQENPS